jgi:hypothetical protein
MIEPVIEPKDKKHPCPYCCGADYWFTATGVVTYTRPVPAGTQRCPYCEGTGVAPRPMGRVP